MGTGNIKKDSDSNYQNTIYKIDNKEYKGNLTSKVLIEHFDIDKVIYIGTNKSMWDNLYHLFGGKDEKYLEFLMERKQKGVSNDDLKRLENFLDETLKAKGSKAILIDYEKNNQDEIWHNFEKLFEIRDYIEDGDEVYLDITHGFRYMPILNIFLLEFISIFKAPNINIKGIYYGMFADNISEIIDFKIFFDLLEWAKAINMFKYSSNSQLLVDLLSKDKTYKGVAKVFSQFNNSLQLANMSSLWQFMKNINKKINILQQTDNKILKLLSNDLIDMTKRFDKDRQSDFQYELALWLYENKNYALSYIALYEAIITKSCELKNYDIDDYKQREEAKKELGDDRWGKYFYTKYDNSLSKIRNSIVHQDNSRKDLVNQDIERLKFFLEKFKSYFEL